MASRVASERRVWKGLLVATRMGLEPTISALTGRYVKPSTPPGRGWNINLYCIRFLCPGQLAFYLGNTTPFHRRSFNAAMIGWAERAM